MKQIFEDFEHWVKDLKSLRLENKSYMKEFSERFDSIYGNWMDRFDYTNRFV